MRLLYFAVLRDVTGKRDDVLELPEGTRAADVWRRMRDEHRALREYAQPPMTAINESYADAEQVGQLAAMSGNISKVWRT